MNQKQNEVRRQRYDIDGKILTDDKYKIVPSKYILEPTIKNEEKLSTTNNHQKANNVYDTKNCDSYFKSIHEKSHPTTGIGIHEHDSLNQNEAGSNTNLDNYDDNKCRKKGNKLSFLLGFLCSSKNKKSLNRRLADSNHAPINLRNIDKPHSRVTDTLSNVVLEILPVDKNFDKSNNQNMIEGKEVVESELPYMKTVDSMKPTENKFLKNRLAKIFEINTDINSHPRDNKKVNGSRSDHKMCKSINFASALDD
jgi:hypothetical protein